MLLEHHDVSKVHNYGSHSITCKQCTTTNKTRTATSCSLKTVHVTCALSRRHTVLTLLGTMQ